VKKPEEGDQGPHHLTTNFPKSQIEAQTSLMEQLPNVATQALTQSIDATMQPTAWNHFHQISPP
jgi:hypothetical protein